MQRILITGFFGLPTPCRAGVQMHHVLRALAPLHEVDVLVIREADQAYVERQGTARILRVPMADDDPRARIEAFRRALRRQLEGADYDIVHFRDGWSGLPVIKLREQLGYTAVFDATRSPAAEPPLRDLKLGAELARAEDGCLLGADHVLVPTEPARAHVRRQRIQGVHLVPAGVDVDLFDWDDPPGGPPAVLYAGAIQAGRGVLVLLRAMAEVAATTDAVLLVAGRIAPGFEQTLQGAVAELGLHDRVELLGEVPHEAMPSLIARASVCVAPSAAELASQPLALYPTKLLEYMACRRAVVAPRRAAATMLIESGAHGLLFNPGDARDLARKLIRLLQDPELRERLAEAAYLMIRQHHTASATRRALRRAYASLGAVGSRQPAGPREEITTPSAARPAVPAPPGASGGDGENTDEVLPLFAQRTMKLRVRPGTTSRAGTDEEEAAPDTVIAPRPAPEDHAPLEPASPPAAARGPRTEKQPALSQPQHDEEIFWSRFEQPVRAEPAGAPDGIPVADSAIEDDEGTPVDGVPLALVPEPNHDHGGNGAATGKMETPPRLDGAIEEDTSFTAESALLGSGKDDPE